MTEAIDESAVLAEMVAKLEAEGLAESATGTLPSGPGLRALSATVAGRLEGVRAEEAMDRGESDDDVWRLSQQPASLVYLRELVQLARDSGMTHIRTGNLEMKFDPDARKATPGDKRTTF